MEKRETTRRRHQIFVAEYLVDSNGKRAAIAAGYSPRCAASRAVKLLSRPDIAKLVQKKTEKVLTKLEISKEKVLQDIAETIERCKQSRPVLDKNGDPVMVETPEGVAVAYKFEPMAVLKGCELLGKHFELFTERVKDVSDKPNGERIVELLSRAAARAAAVPQRQGEGGTNSTP